MKLLLFWHKMWCHSIEQTCIGSIDFQVWACGYEYTRYATMCFLSHGRLVTSTNQAISEKKLNRRPVKQSCSFGRVLFSLAMKKAARQHWNHMLVQTRKMSPASCKWAKGWRLSAFAGRQHDILGHQGSTAILPHWFTLVEEGKNDRQKKKTTPEVQFLKVPRVIATSSAQSTKQILGGIFCWLTKFRNSILCWAYETSHFSRDVYVLGALFETEQVGSDSCHSHNLQFSFAHIT